MTEVDFAYSVREHVADDRRFVIETIARVRQPHGMNWREWERYGMKWATGCLVPDSRLPIPLNPCHVIESDGVILAFVVIYELAIEMLYVKKEFRGLGFGQVLLDSVAAGDPVPCRAPTDSWRMWCARRGIKFRVVA